MNHYDRIAYLITEIFSSTHTKKPRSTTPAQKQAERTRAIYNQDVKDFKEKQQREHEIELAKINMGYPVKDSKFSLTHVSPKGVTKEINFLKK